MAATTHEIGQERSGTKVSAPFRSEHQQALRFETVSDRPTFREFFRWLLKGDYKLAGERVFGNENPEQGRINLTRILESRNHRHGDWEWIDPMLEAAGARIPEGVLGAQEAFVRFICDRFGFDMPSRKPDDEREEERLARVEQSANVLANTANLLLVEVARMRESMEKLKGRK